MMGEAESLTVPGRKSAGWYSVLLLTVAGICACLLLVDWRLPSVRLVSWNTAVTPLTDIEYPPNNSPWPWQCDSAVQKTIQQRGSGLLHSWSDEELLRRAIKAEDILQKLKNATGDLKTISYVDLSVRCRFTRGEKPKIAFMFLTGAGLPLGPVWEEFFKGHDGLYNIYIHAKPDWLRNTGFDERMGVFWGRVVPSGTTIRLDPNIVKAERRLLANALLDDPMNEWFTLISESCIPVRSFGNIYRALNGSEDSRIDCGKNIPGKLMNTRWKARGETAMLPQVPFSEFRLGAQWFSIRRRHAVMVVRDTKYWPKFKLPCIRLEACVPDEHYIQTVVGNLDEGSCEGTPTFVSWNGTRGGHPQGFGKTDTTRHLIEAVQTQNGGRFLFARKFRPDAVEALLNMTDLLFK